MWWLTRCQWRLGGAGLGHPPPDVCWPCPPPARCCQQTCAAAPTDSCLFFQVFMFRFFCVCWGTRELFTLCQVAEIPNERRLCPNNGPENMSQNHPTGSLLLLLDLLMFWCFWSCTMYTQHGTSWSSTTCSKSQAQSA